MGVFQWYFDWETSSLAQVLFLVQKRLVIYCYFNDENIQQIEFISQKRKQFFVLTNLL